jgi:hypothetical protein
VRTPNRLRGKLRFGARANFIEAAAQVEIHLPARYFPQKLRCRVPGSHREWQP